jgi:hypothetical protein
MRYPRPGADGLTHDELLRGVDGSAQAATTAGTTTPELGRRAVELQA